MSQEFARSAIDLIQKRPDMYFDSGFPTMSELIALVLRDLGGQSQFVAEVCREGPFAMVCADVDWMDSKHAKFEELFDRFVLPTPKRVNAHRAEVLLVAVCDGVLSIGTGGIYSLRLELSDVPIGMAERTRSAARALIWKFEPHDG